MYLLFYILIVLMVDSSHFKVMNGTLFMPQKFRKMSFSLSSSHLLFPMGKPCISELYYRPSLECTVPTHW